MPNNNINKQLEEAVYQKNVDEVKALLFRGADPNIYAERHEWNGTLIHATSNVEIVKELISYGARVDARNQYGETPLHRAAIGNLELVRELLKHGAYVNTTNLKGNTPLNFAVKTREPNLEIIKELLEYGADIDIRNWGRRGSDNHRTPLDNAGCYDELLIKYFLIKNFNKDYRKITAFKELTSKIDFLDSCVCEIMKMKSDYSIDNNLSLYEIVIAKEANKEVYVNDESIKSIRNQVFQMTSASYPIYHDIILSKIEAYCLERASLMNKLREIEIYTKLDVSNHVQGLQEERVVLNTDSKSEVAQYLSNNDLLNLTVAFYRCTDEHLCLKRNFTESVTQPNSGLCECDASTSKYAKRAKLEIE